MNDEDAIHETVRVDRLLAAPGVRDALARVADLDHHTFYEDHEIIDAVLDEVGEQPTARRAAAPMEPSPLDPIEEIRKAVIEAKKAVDRLAGLVGPAWHERESLREWRRVTGEGYSDEY